MSALGAVANEWTRKACIGVSEHPKLEAARADAQTARDLAPETHWRAS